MLGAVGGREVATDAPANPGSDATWRTASLCRAHPTRWWFTGDHAESLLARSICAGCPVKVPCLDFALSRPDLFGIWAATSASERTAIRRVERSAGNMPAESDRRAAPTGPRPRLRASVFVRSCVDERFGAGADPACGPDFDETDLLTPAEAARKLGVTPNTVTRWSRAGKISAIQTMGGHRRFRRSEIDRVLRSEGVVATAV